MIYILRNLCVCFVCECHNYKHAQFSSKESVNRNILIRSTVIDKDNKRLFCCFTELFNHLHESEHTTRFSI